MFYSIELWSIGNDRDRKREEETEANVISRTFSRRRKNPFKNILTAPLKLFTPSHWCSGKNKLEHGQTLAYRTSRGPIFQL